MSHLGRSAVLLAVAATVLLAGGLRSAVAVEAVPAGPPACSVVAKATRPVPRSVDFWLQCNIRSSSFSVTGLNRDVRALLSPPELFGPGPEDSVACRIGSQGPRLHGRAPWPISGVLCNGRISALSRVHLRFKLDGKVCARPRTRLGVFVTGSEECDGYCPAGPRISFSVRSQPDRRALGCS